VSRVPVDDFQRVKAGEVLVEIEDDDYRARVAQAAADLLSARAAIENLKARKAAQHAQVAEAEDAMKATQADVERTRLEAARQRTLLATTFGTRQRVEQADAEAERFSATLSRNQADLEAQRSQMAVLDGPASSRNSAGKAQRPTAAIGGRFPPDPFLKDALPEVRCGVESGRSDERDTWTWCSSRRAGRASCPALRRQFRKLTIPRWWRDCTR
jgi:multidrug efflux pump subunit AcrA (membrane-fusion protein)